MTPTKLRDETFTKQELQDVRERLINGEEFSLLAKELFQKIQDRLTKAVTSIGFQWGATAPAFEAMMLKTPVGEVSEVFESQFWLPFSRSIG